MCGNGEYKDALVNGSTSRELELLIFFFFSQIRMLIYMFSIVFPANIRTLLFFFKFYFIFKLYTTVLVLPNIKMKNSFKNIQDGFPDSWFKCCGCELFVCVYLCV